MVRIKFTGAISTARLQHAQIPDDIDSTNSKSLEDFPMTQAEAESDGLPKLAAQENLFLKQRQSLEMVKVMLHVSLGTLFYLREFLPLPCFDDRDLKVALRQPKFSYQDFINSNPGSRTSREDSDIAFGRGKRGQPLKIILRGSDLKADMIIDALETGIFDALSKSVLEAIQLTILVDKDTPDNVLETYTFSFKYSGGLGDLPSRLESLSIEPVGYVADMKSAQTARIGLETIVRRLITLSAFLPTLPSKRTLGIHLFYTEDCPPDYEPPGFTGARDGTINYPLTENWRRETQACGSMDSGCHTVGLKVTSLKWTGPDPEEPECLPEIPTQLVYNDPVQRTEDIGFGGEGVIAQNNTNEASFREATQDVNEREKLQTMMVPTQDTPSDSDLAPTQPIKPGSLLAPENTSPQNKTQRPRLSERKIMEIKESLCLQTHDASENNTTGQKSSVRCQCGWGGEDAAMIECGFCHTRQHLLCYGYDPHDPRIPDVYACYQCLLGPNEAEILHEMGNLALLRRALRIILDEGFPSTTSIFCDKLHCDGQTVIEVTSILRKQNFLQPTPGYKSKGFSRKGLPKFSVPSSDDVRQSIQAKILDPMAKIRHHYTGQLSHDSLRALSPPPTSELDQLSKPNSQEEVIPNSRNEQEGQNTRVPEVSSVSPTKTHSLRSMSSRDNRNGKPPMPRDADRSNKVISTPKTSTRSTRSTPISTRKRTRPSQNEPEVLTVSQESTPAPQSMDEGPRRSVRKRRKISNYSKLINVGADTSGNESG